MLDEASATVELVPPTTVASQLGTLLLNVCGTSTVAGDKVAPLFRCGGSSVREFLLVLIPRSLADFGTEIYCLLMFVLYHDSFPFES